MAADLKQKSLEKLSMEVTKVTNKLSQMKGKSKTELKELEEGDWRIILDSLSKSLKHVMEVLERGEDDCPKVKELEHKTRKLEDFGDHHHQRALRGKFVINSIKANNIIIKEKNLKEQGKSVPCYVAELVLDKLGVSIKEEEIISCHHTTSGLVFRLGDFKPGSTFSRVVNAIKTGQGKENNNLFVNFALTPRRSAILYEIRQLKKSPNSKLTKYYVDYDGNISVVAGQEGKKERVTSVWRKEQEQGGRRKEGGTRGDEARVNRGGFLWTTTSEEIKDNFGQVQVQN